MRLYGYKTKQNQSHNTHNIFSFPKLWENWENKYQLTLNIG
jgi:hypothetical protein